MVQAVENFKRSNMSMLIHMTRSKPEACHISMLTRSALQQKENPWFLYLFQVSALAPDGKFSPIIQRYKTRWHWNLHSFNDFGHNAVRISNYTLFLRPKTTKKSTTTTTTITPRSQANWGRQETQPNTVLDTPINYNQIIAVHK